MRRPEFERAVVLGADGMLGRAWVGQLAARGLPTRECLLPEVDLADPATLAGLGSTLDAETLVVNCAGWTDVDGAEHAEDEAMAVNAHGPGELARVCAQSGASLLHYSTDYVFDGGRIKAYAVDDDVRPINAYGRSKAAGERAVLDSGARAWVVRASWMYAPWGRNFVRTIAGLAEERESLRVVGDQRGRPSSAEQVARVSMALAERGEPGIWHVADGGECSWYELACEVVRRAGAGCRVEECGSDEHRRAAARPAYSVLDLSKTERLLGAMRPWRTSVGEVVDQLAADRERV